MRQSVQTRSVVRAVAIAPSRRGLRRKEKKRLAVTTAVSDITAGMSLEEAE